MNCSRKVLKIVTSCNGFFVVFGCTLMVKTYCKRLAVYVEEVKIAHACTHTTYKN